MTINELIEHLTELRDAAPGNGDLPACIVDWRQSEIRPERLFAPAVLHAEVINIIDRDYINGDGPHLEIGCDRLSRAMLDKAKRDSAPSPAPE